MGTAARSTLTGLIALIALFIGYMGVHSGMAPSFASPASNSYLANPEQEAADAYAYCSLHQGDGCWPQAYSGSPRTARNLR